MEHDPNRRSIIAWAIYGISAIFSAIIGIPALCYFIDPRHRKAPESSFKVVEGIKLDELVENNPVQGVIRDRRVDGWTLYPNDVIGRVWVIERCARPVFQSVADVKRFNDDAESKERFLWVYTTICPHLGCFVNLDATGTAFACPCHAATFRADGERAADSNPAKRGMDRLEWEIDTDDPDFNRLKVKYVRYKTLEDRKIPLGSD